MIITTRPFRERLVMPSRQRGFFTMPGGMGSARPGDGPTPPYQDLSTYTEVDASSRLTVTSLRVTALNLQRNVTAYLYKDFGVDHFSGNVSIDFDLRLTASNNGGLVEFIGLANQVGDFNSRSNALSVVLYRDATNNILQLMEVDGGVQYTDTANISLNTTYYCRFVRDESVGTFGTGYLYLAASDSNRTSDTWIDTLTMTLHSSLKDFRYLYACAGLFTSGNTASISSWSEKYLINAP